MSIYIFLAAGGGAKEGLDCGGGVPVMGSFELHDKNCSARQWGNGGKHIGVVHIREYGARFGCDRWRGCAPR